jgi:uncharacterized protein (TIGR03086 family)
MPWWTTSCGTSTARASRAEGKPGVPGLTGDDWTGEYREAADELLRAWCSDGALEGIIKLPFGELPPTWFLGQQTADLVAHGWDLAKATDLRVEFDEELTRFALEWGRENLRPSSGARTSGRKSRCRRTHLRSIASSRSSAGVAIGRRSRALPDRTSGASPFDS